MIRITGIITAILIIALSVFANNCTIAQTTAYSTSTPGNTISPPNIDSLRTNLFACFRRHLADTAFDTTDDTYVRSYQGINFPPYAIKMGHLFSKRQLHAVIFWDDDRSTGIQVYKRQGKTWQLIFKDTTLRGITGEDQPEFKDWNNDGIKDMTVRVSEHMYAIDAYDLWVMDSGGNHLSKVKHFRDIGDPQTEPGTFHITSDVMPSNIMVHAEYTLKGKTLLNNYSIQIACLGDNDDIRFDITQARNGKVISRKVCDKAHLLRSVPASVKELVKANYFE